MNVKSCSRMVWKESVEMLPLGIATIVGIVAFQMLVAYLGSQQLLGNRVELKSMQFVGITLALIFTGAVSATLFNREADRKTLYFLQSLPMTVREIYMGKIVPLIAWTLLLLTFGLISSWAVVRLFGVTKTTNLIPQQMAWIVGLALLVGIMGITCSLRFKDCYASLVGTAGGLLVWWISIVFLFDTFPPSFNLRELDWLMTTVASAPILLLSFQPKMATRFLYRSDDAFTWLPRAANRTARQTSTSGIAKRLVWQQIWHVRYVTLVALLLSAYFSIVAVSAHFAVKMFVCALSCSICTSLIGGLTFYVDQHQQGYRFFANRGISPTKLWWNRNWVSFALAVLSASPILIFGTSSLFAELNSRNSTFSWGEYGFAVRRGFGIGMLMLPVLAVAVGQFFSQRLASPILNLFCVFVAMSVLVPWQFFTAALGIPLSISVVPLIAALFLATWIYMPNWLVEKRSLRYGWRSLAVPCVAAVVCYLGASLYRVLEIPSVTLTSSSTIVAVDERSNDTESESAIWTELMGAQTHLHAVFQMEWLSTDSPPFVRVHHTDGRDDYRKCEDQLSEVMDPTHEFRFPLPSEVTKRYSGWSLPPFLLSFARIRESQGNIDEAWAIYVRQFEVFDALRLRSTIPRWQLANAYEQHTLSCLRLWALQANPDQRNAAIDFLKNRTQRLGQLEQLVFDNRFFNHRQMRDPDAFELGPSPTQAIFLFEQQRMERLVDRTANLQLASIEPYVGRRSRELEPDWIDTNQLRSTSFPLLTELVDLHIESERLFLHRQITLTHALVLQKLLASPESTPADALREALLLPNLQGLKVSLVPARQSLSLEQHVQYGDSLYQFAEPAMPDWWPRLLVQVPNYVNIHAPIPPTLGGDQ